MTEFNLEAIDVDGAVREAAEAVSGDTRLGFLRKAGIAGGTALSGGAILGAIAAPALAAGSGRPPAKFGTGDVGILNYALTLEYLEAAFYNLAVSKGGVKSPHTKVFLQTAVRDENDHVKILKQALGRKAVKKPKFNFLGNANTESKFIATAFVLENTGVHAYLGQLRNIQSSAYVTVASEIVTIEARHAGAVGLLAETSSTPFSIAPNGSLDSGYSAARILAAVKATGFIVG